MTTVSLRAVQRWSAQQTAPVHLELLCAEHPGVGAGSSTAVRLGGCAADLPVHELAELLTLGAEEVTVDLRGCAAVDAATARLEPLVRVLRAGQVDRLCLIGPDAVGTATPDRPVRRRRAVLDAAQMPVPRRQALGLAPAVGRELPAENLPPQQRLVDALRALVPEPGPDLEELTGPAVRLAAHGCTACEVCVRACPEDVLGVRHGAAGPTLAISTLVQSAETCTGCLRCVDLCPAGALTVTGAWSWAEVLDGRSAGVATVATARCERCGTRFPTTSSTRWCQVCAYRREHPFGSTLPPGAGRPPTAGTGADPALARVGQDRRGRVSPSTARW